MYVDHVEHHGTLCATAWGWREGSVRGCVDGCVRNWSLREAACEPPLRTREELRGWREELGRKGCRT